MDGGPMVAAKGDSPTAAGQAQPSAGRIPRGAGRHVLVLGAAVTAIAVVALLLVATATRPVTRFAPDTPEAAFQAYLTAWDAHDLDAAYATFSARVRAGLPLDNYKAQAVGYRQPGADRRVVLLNSSMTGARALLDLRIDELGGGGLFGAQSVWSRETTVGLVREQDAWRLDVPLADLEPVYWAQP